MKRASIVLIALLAAACGTGSASFDETPVLPVAADLLRDDAFATAKSIPVCIGDDMNFSPSAETFTALQKLDDRIASCRRPDMTPNVVYLRIRTVTKKEADRYVVRGGLYCPPPNDLRRDCTSDVDYVVGHVDGEWRLIPYRGLAY